MRKVVVAALAVAALVWVAPAGALTQTTIFAGQHIDAGQLSITNSTTDFVLVIEGSNGWEIAELHIYVGTDPVPVNGGGRPAPGQFPYSFEFSDATSSHIFTLPLEAAGTTCPAGPSVNIAVHLVMVNAATGQTETGWAFGPDEFPKGWGWSLPYESECDGER